MKKLSSLSQNNLRMLPKTAPLLLTLEGIFVSAPKESFYGYQLITDQGTFFLDLNSKLLKLLKNHEWETLIVKGLFLSSKVFDVKSAQIKPENPPSFFDFSKNFDFHCYEKAIESGFPLNPMEEAI